MEVLGEYFGCYKSDYDFINEELKKDAQELQTKQK